MDTGWDSQLAKLLTDLLNVQDETLTVLSKKRDLLLAADAEGLAELSKQETGLIAQLQECLDRREGLLQRAAAEGLPSDSLRSLSKALPKGPKGEIPNQIKRATSRSRLLQHHGLANWVLVQRSLIHLSQMLEIIATGGRPQPTYEKGKSAAGSGALVDRAA